MAKKVSVLVNSLHKDSFARKVARNVIPTFPAGYEVQIIEIGHLPLYGLDYDDPDETDFPTPESYILLCGTIKASSGTLFVTLENNHTVPVCLKSAVDIGSKPNTDAAWKRTPVGTTSHSVGKMGDYSSQRNLCLALSYLDMPLTGQSEAFLGNSPILSDDSGKLAESARGLVRGYINQLVALIKKDPK